MPSPDYNGARFGRNIQIQHSLTHIPHCRDEPEFGTEEDLSVESDSMRRTNFLISTAARKSFSGPTQPRRLQTINAV
jgi:hypothetical protein